MKGRPLLAVAHEASVGFGDGAPVVDAAGHGVEVVSDGVVVDDRVAEVGTFGQLASQCPVGGPLPGYVRVAGESGQAQTGLELFPVGHLAALIPGR